jgi:hypothetical protein
MPLYTGFIQLGAGLSVGLAGLAAGFAIGIVGDAGVRGTAQQPRLFVGMILILIVRRKAVVGCPCVRMRLTVRTSLLLISSLRSSVSTASSSPSSSTRAATRPPMCVSPPASSSCAGSGSSADVFGCHSASSTKPCNKARRRRRATDGVEGGGVGSREGSAASRPVQGRDGWGCCSDAGTCLPTRPLDRP